jgi:hypothetical protein
LFLRGGAQITAQDSGKTKIKDLGFCESSDGDDIKNTPTPIEKLEVELKLKK